MGQLELAVKQRAAELGFHLVGIASAEPFETAERRSLDWLQRGFQAGMGWMDASRARLACHPDELLPGSRSIISVGVSYLTESREPAPESSRGCVARYARGDDYHELMRQRLWRLVGFLAEQSGGTCRARVFVDSSPFLDREAAVRAGLGFYGKNTMLLTAPLGSYLFLGAILTDARLEPDVVQPRDCGQCRLCLDACPTGALVEPYQLDAGRCISYLTIEHRGAIPRELRSLLGDHIFGCDICQEVCPWNRRLPREGWPAFLPRPETGVRPELATLLRLDDHAFRARFRNSPISRAKRSGLLRNTAIALGNARDRRAVPALERALRDGDSAVRSHAAWALGRVGGGAARAALAAALETEDEASVREEIREALAQAEETAAR
jgi:epoxyqueuosine reductase